MVRATAAAARIRSVSVGVAGELGGQVADLSRSSISTPVAPDGVGRAAACRSPTWLRVPGSSLSCVSIRVEQRRAKLAGTSASAAALLRYGASASSTARLPRLYALAVAAPRRVGPARRAAAPRRRARSAARGPGRRRPRQHGRCAPGRRRWRLPMWSTRPLVPTTIVAMVGTIMMRPSLDQIGRSRSRPTGRRRRDRTPSAVVGRLLTSPPSGSGAACASPRAPHSDRPGGSDLRDSITPRAKRKPRLSGSPDV